MIGIPALNHARFNHLIRLARECEKRASYCGWRVQEQLLKLAATYRDMALAAMPSATPDDIRDMAASDRARLAAKLRAMTVENGCTPAEAATALEKLWRLEAMP